jgi:uncharacterized membrane protein YvbJ
MFCRKCGAVNNDNAYKCVQCGEILQAAVQGQPQQQLPSVASHLALAILVTLFCCVPFGIVSIVYAAQVNSKLQAGDYNGALNCSKKAATWGWVGFGCGLVGVLIWVGLSLFGFLQSRPY